MLIGHSYVIPDDDPDQYRFKRQSTWNVDYGAPIKRYRRKPLNRPMLWATFVLLACTFGMLLVGRS